MLGSSIITDQISGQMEYRRKEMPKASEKSIVFRAKATTLNQYSQRASHGIVKQMIETAPVPIVVANQLGEKCLTTRRHPWSFFEGAGGRDVVGSELVSGVWRSSFFSLPFVTG